jgi:hypothetical protein
MGLLKHLAIPVFCVVHAYAIYTISISGDIPGGIKTFQWPPKEGKNQGLTLWEKHLFGMVAAAHASFFVVCLLGIFREHSHFRGIVAIMEATFWAVGSHNAVGLGFPYELSVGLAGLAVLGLIVHSLEPGLFTKDKSKSKSS